MRQIQLGSRTDAPAFFDMAGRWRPSLKARWYGSKFRIGDKAVVYSILANWRKSNPTRKLTIIADPPAHETAWGWGILNSWVFGEIADELIEADVGNELLPQPLGPNLYTEHLFTSWRTLSRRPPLRPAPALPTDCNQWAVQALKKWNVPDRYVVVSPLFDSKYDRHRNLHTSWWQKLTAELTKAHPVVLIGDQTSMRAYRAKPIRNCFNLYQDGLTPMHSLALIERSAAYAGGETGMTLWAALLKRPVVAAYQFWSQPWVKNRLRGIDTRPISAGAPVVWACPANGAVAIAHQVNGLVGR